jgi:hypothetical protein
LLQKWFNRRISRTFYFFRFIVIRLVCLLIFFLVIYLTNLAFRGVWDFWCLKIVCELFLSFEAVFKILVFEIIKLWLVLH